MNPHDTLAESFAGPGADRIIRWQDWTFSIAGSSARYSTFNAAYLEAAKRAR